MVRLIDVHTHLQMLEATPEAAVDEAVKHGVQAMVTIGTQPSDWPAVLDMAERLAPAVFGTLGLHPHDAKEWTPEAETFLLENLAHPRIIAVGEIGLDYYYLHSTVEKQKQVFRRQMEMAAEMNLPVEIHSRDAEEDTVAILREFAGRVRGLIHCFTGSLPFAQAALQLGYDISISGVVTFPKAEELRSIVKQIPLERLHVETDAPFLTPVPFRGKKNRPVWVTATAERVAELHQVPITKFSEVTRENAQRLFQKMQIGSFG